MKNASKYIKKCQETFQTFTDSDFYGPLCKHVYFYGHVSQETVTKFREEITNAITFSTNVKVKTKPIVIHLHSPGGDAHLGLALSNIISEISIPLAVIVDGYACSAITPLLISSCYRVMHSQSYVMIHEGSLTYDETTSIKFGDMKFDSHLIDLLTNNYKKLYEANSKIPPNILMDLLNRDKFLGSRECLKYALVDRVINIDFAKSRHQLHKIENIDISDITLNHLIIKEFNELPQVNNRQKIYLTFEKNVQEFQKILETKDAKSLVLHASFPDQSSVFDVATFLVRTALSNVHVIGVIDSSIDIVGALPIFMAHTRFMFSNTIIRFNVGLRGANSKSSELRKNYYKDIKENTDLLHGTLMRFLKIHSSPKMTNKIIQELFNEGQRQVLTAEQCKQYGLVDFVIQPLQRTHNGGCGTCSQGLPIS